MNTDMFSEGQTVTRQREHEATEAWPNFASEESIARREEVRQFGMMQVAFMRTGGLAMDDFVVDQIRRHASQPISVLAHWIVERIIVGFQWESRTLVPLFQFNPVDMTPWPGTCEIVRELIDVFDDWDLAVWFAQPNCWLGHESPVDAIKHNQPAVHQAARADRFITRG